MAAHHGSDHTEHKHGEMDVSVQEKTFDAFMKFSTRTAIVIVVVLILLAMFRI